MFISTVLVMPSKHLILWHPLLLLPSIFPSIRNFSNESAIHIRWPKYWSFIFSTSSSKEYLGLTSLKIDWFNLVLSKGVSEVFSSTTVYKGINSSVLPLLYGLPWWLRLLRTHLQCGKPGFDPWVGKIPWRKEWLPIPVFFLQNSMDRGV